MSGYKTTFEKAAIKFLKKQTPKMQSMILMAISKLPEGTDIKKLQGYELYRMRVGNVRVIYSIDNDVKIINIENIDNRGQIYKRY
jgi:mRNA interferase RelE/StbE